MTQIMNIPAHKALTESDDIKSMSKKVFVFESRADKEEFR
jgi:hypothetical protein